MPVVLFAEQELKKQTTSTCETQGRLLIGQPDQEGACCPECRGQLVLVAAPQLPWLPDSPES